MYILTLKSKHLECATFNLYGLDIDLTQLRTGNINQLHEFIPVEKDLLIPQGYMPCKDCKW